MTNGSRRLRKETFVDPSNATDRHEEQAEVYFQDSAQSWLLALPGVTTNAFHLDRKNRGDEGIDSRSHAIQGVEADKSGRERGGFALVALCVCTAR
jgi:hypothetical protein